MTSQKYDATTIQVLKGIDAVRKRPAMYIGDTSIGGLHHLVYEVVDNSIDEAMAGQCDEIKVRINSDNSVTVEDNGRGIPVDLHKTENRPALEVVMTVLHAGGKFDKKAYRVSGGLHGVGVSVVNALSEWLEVNVKRDGKVYHQKYEKGTPVSEVTVVGKTKTTGTKVTFKPDEDIFETLEFDDGILAGRLKELAFLNGGIKITFIDERKDLKEFYKFDGGLVSFVEFLTKNKKSLFAPPMYFKKIENDIELEVAFQYHDGYNESVLCFANNVNTKEGGTHLTGFRGGLTRAINEYGKHNGFLENSGLSGEDMREGIAAVISVKLPEPQFEGQTKTKLGNSRVRFLVEGLAFRHILMYLEENPEPARAILEKCVLTARSREAARKARDITRKKLAEGGALPGKLADCSIKDPAQRELFMVEGDSAGGSAKQGRDRMFQAILPLKGKIINTEKASIDKVLNNDEIKTMISAIGAGVGDEFDISKVRYRKIIIMTDADVDGAHIRTLLLTFFYRQMTELIKNGCVYIAQPPLYKIKKGKKEFYVDTDMDMEKILFGFAQDSVKVYIKGDSEQLKPDQVEKLAGFAKRFQEIKSRIEKKGIVFSEYIKDWNKKQKLPVYWIKYRDESYYFDIDTELSLFMKEKDLEQLDLFSAETKDYKLVEIFESKELEKILMSFQKLGVPFEKEKEEIFSIEDDGKIEKVVMDDFCDCLKEAGKKGITVQRYKGLGEMNPSQLWETTMDREKRRLLQVEIEDAVKAENIFTVLMGEEVEPRRQFIQAYAKEVKNLDI